MSMCATGQRLDNVILTGQTWRKNKEKGVRRIYKDLNKNGEGYPDYVAARAIQAADKQPENVENAIRRMKTVARWHNLEVIGRIWLRDPETGKEYK